LLPDRTVDRPPVQTRHAEVTHNHVVRVLREPLEGVQQLLQPTPPNQGISSTWPGKMTFGLLPIFFWFSLLS
jgi:hypothetical protein